MRYFIYVRKSTESEERQKMSISSQISELKLFSKKEKLEVVDSFQESKTAKQPGRSQFGLMIKGIEEGKADGILAWHPDRLARNSVDGGKIVYLLDTGKLKDLKFPTFWFENTPQGKFSLNIAFSQSKYYVDNLSENIKRGYRQKLRQGLLPSIAPFGYLNNRYTKGIDIDPPKAKYVRLAFSLYATGDYTIKSIANFFEKKGLRSLKGHVLSYSCIHRLLKNPVYYGVIRFNDQIYQGVHKPLITKKLFDQVQAVFGHRTSKIKRRKTHNYPFTGLIHCKSCTCSITAEKQKGHIYYRCTKKKGVCSQKYLRQDLLVKQMSYIIKKVSLKDGWAEKMIRELDRDKVSYQKLDNSITQKLTAKRLQISSKLDHLLDLNLDGLIDQDQYNRKRSQLINQKVDIDQSLREFRSQSQNRLEPIYKLIFSASQAKKLINTKDYNKMYFFMKKIGSNFLLNNQKLEFDPKIGWRVLLKNTDCPDWRRVRDSNP